MKIKRLSLLVFTALLVLSSSCKYTTSKNDNISTEDVKTEFREAIDTTSAYVNMEKQDILNDLDARINDAENRIAELKDNISSQSAQVRLRYQTRIESIDSYISETKRSAEILRTASEDAWNEMLSGLDSAIVDIDRAIEDAKTEFEF